MANRTTCTPKKMEKFLKALRETGNVSDAARSAGLARRTAYAERERNEDFARDWADACEAGIDALEAEARRRAFAGVGETIWYQGKPVGQVRTIR